MHAYLPCSCNMPGPRHFYMSARWGHGTPTAPPSKSRQTKMTKGGPTFPGKLENSIRPLRVRGRRTHGCGTYTAPEAPPNTMDGFKDDSFMDSAARSLRSHIAGLAEGPQRFAKPIVLFSLHTSAIRQAGPSESQFLPPFTPITALAASRASVTLGPKTHLANHVAKRCSNTSSVASGSSEWWHTPAMTNWCQRELGSHSNPPDGAVGVLRFSSRRIR